MKAHHSPTKRRKRRADDRAESGEPMRAPHPIAAMQRAVGNAAVERALAQRYPVRVAKDASCDQVTNWLSQHSPYAPEAAQTRAQFTWKGEWVITGKAPRFRLRMRNASVTMHGPDVDMPEWQPTNPAVRAAWDDMYARLRRHEADHEQIAWDWKTILAERLANLSLEVTAASRKEVERRAQALINAKWRGWIAEFRAEMRSIDPHTEELHCPTADGEPSGDGGDDGGDAAMAKGRRI